MSPKWISRSPSMASDSGVISQANTAKKEWHLTPPCRREVAVSGLPMQVVMNSLRRSSLHKPTVVNMLSALLDNSGTKKVIWCDLGSPGFIYAPVFSRKASPLLVVPYCIATIWFKKPQCWYGMDCGLWIVDFVQACLIESRDRMFRFLRRHMRRHFGP